jgi:hypothetical protein
LKWSFLALIDCLALLVCFDCVAYLDSVECLACFVCLECVACFDLNYGNKPFQRYDVYS